MSNSNQTENQESGSQHKMEKYFLQKNMNSSITIDHETNTEIHNPKITISKEIMLLPNNFLPRHEMTILDNLSLNLKVKWPFIKILFIPPVLIELMNEFIYYLLEINVQYYREKFNTCYNAFMSHLSYQTCGYNIDNYVLFVLMNQIVIDFLRARYNPNLVQMVTICYNTILGTDYSPERLLFYYHTYLYNFELALKSDQSQLIPLMAEIRLIAFLPRFMTQTQLAQVRMHIKQYDNGRLSQWNELNVISSEMQCEGDSKNMKNISNEHTTTTTPECNNVSYEEPSQKIDLNKDITSEKTQECVPPYFNEEILEKYSTIFKFIEQFKKHQSCNYDTCLQVLYMQIVLCLSRNDNQNMLSIKEKIKLYVNVVDKIKELIDVIESMEYPTVALFELCNLICWYNDVNLQCQSILLNIVRGSCDDDLLSVSINNNDRLFETVSTENSLLNLNNTVNSNNSDDDVKYNNTISTENIKMNESLSMHNSSCIPSPSQSMRILLNIFVHQLPLHSTKLDNNEKAKHCSNLLQEHLRDDPSMFFFNWMNLKHYHYNKMICDWLRACFMGNDENFIFQAIDILYDCSSLSSEETNHYCNSFQFCSIIENDPIIFDIIIERLYNIFESIIEMLSILPRKYSLIDFNRNSLYNIIEKLNTIKFHVIDNIHELNNCQYINCDRLYKFYSSYFPNFITKNDDDQIDIIFKSSYMMNVCTCWEFSQLHSIENIRQLYIFFKDYNLDKHTIFENIFNRLANLSINAIKLINILALNMKNLIKKLSLESKKRMFTYIIDVLYLFHHSNGLNFYFKNEFIMECKKKYSTPNNNTIIMYDVVVDKKKNEIVTDFYVMLLILLNEVIDVILMDKTILDSVVIKLLHILSHLIYCNNLPHCNIDIQWFDDRYVNSSSIDNINPINSCFVVDCLCLKMLSKIFYSNTIFVDNFHSILLFCDSKRCCLPLSNFSPLCYLVDRLIYHKIPLIENGYAKIFYYEWLAIFLNNIIYNENQAIISSSHTVINNMKSNLITNDQIDMYYHLCDIFYDIIQNNILYMAVCYKMDHNYNTTQNVLLVIKCIRLLHFFINILNGTPMYNFLDKFVFRLGYLIANVSNWFPSNNNGIKLDKHFYSFFNTICNEYSALFQ